MESPKTYPAPWQGSLLLACRKCQKKLKGTKRATGLAKLRKTAQRMGERHPEHALYVLNVPCMDLCPKDGVTICDPSQRPPRLEILRSKARLHELMVSRTAKTQLVQEQ